MKRTTALSAAALLVAVTQWDAVQAHHSGSVYATSPLWIAGTVVGFEPSNPHTLTTLESRLEDGSVKRWVVEGPPQARIAAARVELDVPAVGDTIGFCAFPYKPIDELVRIFPETEGRWSTTLGDSSSQRVTGHVMLLADGSKQFWEPHGVIAECVRSSDEARQVWLDFLNTDRNARQAWCQQKSYLIVTTDAPLHEIVETFDQRLDAPCD